MFQIVWKYWKILYSLKNKVKISDYFDCYKKKILIQKSF